MLDREWLSMDGDPIDLKIEIEQLTREPGKIILIGTDSQRFEKRLDFVTAIVVRTPLKGGRIFYTREKSPTIYNLRDKLIKEALMSIQTAWALAPILPEHTKIAALHADVNTDIKKGKSAKYQAEICGMISGNGFSVVPKPDGWVANCVANHVVNYRHDKAKEEMKKWKKQKLVRSAM